MNPLGPLPASTSPKFSLQSLDLQKIGRFTLVQGIGAFATYAPMLAGYKYEFGGIDFTPFVVSGVPVLVEAARRWLTNNQAAA